MIYRRERVSAWEEKERRRVKRVERREKINSSQSNDRSVNVHKMQRAVTEMLIQQKYWSSARATEFFFPFKGSTFKHENEYGFLS